MIRCGFEMMRRKFFLHNQGNISKIKCKTNNKGFSLVELIIVIAIMAVLVAVVAPMYMNTARHRQATACETNRKAIAGIFERRVYDDQKEMTTTDLEFVMDGNDSLTAGEVKQYTYCPLKGSFTGKIEGNAIVIECSHADHDPVRVEVTGWSDATIKVEGTDREITEP